MIRCNTCGVSVASKSFKRHLISQSHKLYEGVQASIQSDDISMTSNTSVRDDLSASDIDDEERQQHNSMLLSSTAVNVRLTEEMLHLHDRAFSQQVCLLLLLQVVMKLTIIKIIITILLNV